MAVLVFFVVVVVYISFRFEWKMAMAALIAVIHDLLVTAGIYSLAGFQVTPDTVIALLTILGYSLYDTVVVFDRVKENSRGRFGAGRMTYTDIVNLSMNQTLARSINTSLVAILPVLAVLVIGAAAPRGHDAAVLRPGPGHRAHLGGLLVDLHRLPGAGRAQRARASATSTSGASSQNRAEGRACSRRAAAVLAQAASARWHPGGRPRRAGRPAPARRAARGARRPVPSRRRRADGGEDDDGGRRSADADDESAADRAGGAGQERRPPPARRRCAARPSSPRRPPPRPRKGKGGAKKAGKRR